MSIHGFEKSIGDIACISPALPCICGISGGLDFCVGKTIGKSVIPPEPPGDAITTFATLEN